MEFILLVTVGLILMLVVANILLLTHAIYSKFIDGVIYAAFTVITCAFMLYFIWLVLPLLK